MPRRQVVVEWVGFPGDSDSVALGVGADSATGEQTRFVVPPEAVLRVLAELHAGRKPRLLVADFDVVDWTMWWEKAE